MADDPQNQARAFVASVLAKKCQLPASFFKDDDTLQDYVSALHLPELATLINAGGWRHVRVTVPEVAGCDKIKNLIDLVAKKGH
jgi:hypothetical protein